MQSLLLLPLLLFISEATARKVPKRLIQRFTICLTGDSDVVKGSIKTGGYFEHRENSHRIYSYGRATVVTDSSFSRIMLYKDGSFHNELFAYGASIGCRDTAVAHNPDDWGVFRISHDTITAQLVQRFYSLNGGGWGLYELKYRIINSRFLQFIQREMLFPRDDPHDHIATGDTDRRKIELQPWRFVSCDKIRPVSYWLKG